MYSAFSGASRFSTAYATMSHTIQAAVAKAVPSTTLFRKTAPRLWSPLSIHQSHPPSPSTAMHAIATTRAGTVAVACPYCAIMLDDGAKDRGGNLEVLDLAQVLERSLARE